MSDETLEGWVKIAGYDEEGEPAYSFTDTGLRSVLEMYVFYKQGVSVEELEEMFGLHSGEGEEEHIDFRILMAIGNLTGLLDHYDELEEITRMLDEVEDEVQ